MAGIFGLEDKMIGTILLIALIAVVGYILLSKTALKK